MGKLRARPHLDRDPNDPRLRGDTPPLPSLNEEPEAPLVPKEVVEVVTERANTAGTSGAPEWDCEQTVCTLTRVGLDPNDVRLADR